MAVYGEIWELGNQYTQNSWCSKCTLNHRGRVIIKHKRLHATTLPAPLVPSPCMPALPFLGLVTRDVLGPRWLPESRQQLSRPLVQRQLLDPAPPSTGSRQQPVGVACCTTIFVATPGNLPPSLPR